MQTLEHLNRVNDVPIHSIESDEFSTYGRIVRGLDFSSLIEYMEEKTEIPDENIYVPSVPQMEVLAVKDEIQRNIYGGMEIQIGFCNGKNSTFNGFEYHKGSELNIAVTDFMIFLGHVWEIRENKYKVSDAKVFFVKKGTAFEMFQTTLHLSPIRAAADGFKAVVVLPKGTNTPLDASRSLNTACNTMEERLLLKKNKWVIAHPERKPLVAQGAFAGIIGKNKALNF